MSILIKGAQIPKGDRGLVLVIFKDGTVYSPGLLTNGLVREKNVEAIAVPTPRGRLIDADELYHEMAKHSTAWEYGEGVGDCIKDLENAPTVVESEE